MGRGETYIVTVISIGAGVLVTALSLVYGRELAWIGAVVGAMMIAGGLLGLLWLRGIFPSPATQARLARLWIRTKGVMTEIRGETPYASRDEALALVRSSAWARYRQALTQQKLTFSELVSGRMLGGQDPLERPQGQLFNRWCDAVLRAFERENPHAVRGIENEELQFSENDLIAWLDGKYERQAIEKFGEI